MLLHTGSNLNDQEITQTKLEGIESGGKDTYIIFFILSKIIAKPQNIQSTTSEIRETYEHPSSVHSVSTAFIMMTAVGTE